jgi:putative membrane protein
MRQSGGEDMMWSYHDGGGWWIAVWMCMVVFWAFVGLGAIWVTSNIRHSDRQSTEPPEEILARRLASGEIDEERYRSLRDALSGRGGPSASAP